jgi:hypothetical protein
MLLRPLLKTVGLMEGQKKIVDFVGCFQQEHKI